MSTPKLAETARTNDAAGRGYCRVSYRDGLPANQPAPREETVERFVNGSEGRMRFGRNYGRAPWIRGLQVAFGNDGSLVQIVVADRSQAKSGQKEAALTSCSYRTFT